MDDPCICARTHDGDDGDDGDERYVTERRGSIFLGDEDRVSLLFLLPLLLPATTLEARDSRVQPTEAYVTITTTHHPSDPPHIFWG